MADTTGNPAGDLANELMDSLLDGVQIEFPPIDLEDPEFEIPDVSGIGGPVVRLTNADLTSGMVGGTGIFDILMKAGEAHLKQEYEKNRITGEFYSKAYTAMIEGVLGQGTQFLLARDQAYWTALGAQLQAQAQAIALVTARVQMETAKAQLISQRYEALGQEANYALSKMRLAGESVNFDTAKYNLEQMLPEQLATAKLQRAGVQIQNDTGTFQLTQMLPAQKTMLDSQVEAQGIQTDTARYNLQTMLPLQFDTGVIQKLGAQLQNDTATFNLNELLPVQKTLAVAQKLGADLSNQKAQYELSNLLPLQKSAAEKQLAAAILANDTTAYQLANNLPAQVALLLEQLEVQRSQTADTRSDGYTPILGAVGKQKEVQDKQIQLYSQQILSFKLDGQLKGAKIFVDAWITQKGLDEATLPPDNFTNAILDPILTKIRVDNDLD